MSMLIVNSLRARGAVTEETMRERINTLTLIVIGLLLCVTSCRSLVRRDIDVSITHARRVVNLNRNWRFSRGNPPGAEAVDFNDTAWETVRIPHDWAISGPFNEEEDGYAGKLPWKGVAWYRKSFMLLGADQGKQVYLDFDGVMAFPRVYVNGQLAGTWDYGYMSFRVDATPYVRFGTVNMIAMQVDTRRHDTRWYPGAGIYRKVTMTVCQPVHIAHWGTFVTTPQVSTHSATVQVQSTIENHGHTDAAISVEVIIRDPADRVVARDGKTLKDAINAGAQVEVVQHLVVSKPRLWDITGPWLYTAQTILRAGDTIIDMDTATFGIRTYQFTAHDGFHLNGRRVQLHGVNLHHDQGPLGAAFYTRAMERQLEIMQDMGCNAIRTSHNPPAPELLDLCDRMGLVVWNECFDKWDAKADRVHGESLESFGQKQIRNFVMRDRNHPSVVMWSIGNEISNQPDAPEGKSAERVRFMSGFVRRYDPTRPVGMGCHIPETVDRPILDDLDMTGWNYTRRYARYRERYPDKPIVYSESASALSTRGFYELPLPNRKIDYSTQYQVNSYDLNAAPWSDIADVEFRLMEQDRFVAGEFVWTGFDYLGEPTPFTRQARSSYFGIVDLCGIPKDRFYLYRSYWRPDVTTIHILPHWNWPQRVGQKVPVFVYTNGDSAELFLKGRSLGRRTKGQLPERPENLALDRPACASSVDTDKGHLAAHANDGRDETRWCATGPGAHQWWQVDLGAVRSIGCVAIMFERESKLYGYDIEVSGDMSHWQTIVTKGTSNEPRWGGCSRIFHTVTAQARYVRIAFTEMQAGTWASIREFGVYTQEMESDYYDPTYDYRLRWNDVVYEPGTLEVVAYKDGQKIGTAVMRTAYEPEVIRLTPDRKLLQATGEDLCYVLVEALDRRDTPCPLADNMVYFHIDGPADIAGVGNGNPLSLEPFQADHRRLFYGKAMLILRTREGDPGTIRILAESDQLTCEAVTVQCQ